MGLKKLIDLSEKEEMMLNLLMYKETDLVAQELGVKEYTIYQRLYRIRKRVDEAQKLINKINAYKNKSPRLRKLLTEPKLLKKKEKKE
jgi:hypothetical protein